MVVTKIFINIVCSYFSGCDRFDCSCRSGRAVTADKYTRHTLYRSIKSCLEYMPFCRHTKRFERFTDNILSNGDQYDITRNTQWFFGCGIDR